MRAGGGSRNEPVEGFSTPSDGPSQLEGTGWCTDVCRAKQHFARVHGPSYPTILTVSSHSGQFLKLRYCDSDFGGQVAGFKDQPFDKPCMQNEPRPGGPCTNLPIK